MKGFIRRRAGELKNFTGVDSAYETPKSPEIGYLPWKWMQRWLLTRCSSGCGNINTFDFVRSIASHHIQVEPMFLLAVYSKSPLVNGAFVLA